MALVFTERTRALLAPPKYLALPLCGIDISTSGVKAVRLVEGVHGLRIAKTAQVRLPAGVYTDGEVVDRAAIVEAIVSTTELIGASKANVALPESKSYLFDTAAAGVTEAERRTAIEQRLDEFVPLPPEDTVFDFVETGRDDNGDVRITGIGFAKRMVDDTLATFDQADIGLSSLEGEIFATARAILPHGDESTVLIIDVGKTTTKLLVVTKRIPRYATTINIGGHALTLAVQKYFGVTDAEARRVKVEHGIVPTPGNEEYLAAMLLTVSAIRDEISRHLAYWQQRALRDGKHESVSRVIIVGGNGSVRGLPEYLEDALRIPVTTGDVFTNFASRDTWIPELDYSESLAYATSIGLALRDHAALYEH